MAIEEDKKTKKKQMCQLLFKTGLNQVGSLLFMHLIFTLLTNYIDLLLQILGSLGFHTNGFVTRSWNNSLRTAVGIKPSFAISSLIVGTSMSIMTQALCPEDYSFILILLEMLLLTRTNNANYSMVLWYWLIFRK